ncbi:AGAP005812-PA [Anopheles gambiae str. PEST]|uniref:Elongator complex protein 5 n=1 Tax=Anopheles gambiae TaxID=7165 RepID=Q5TRC5_ANOGA|nr:AGAP005812-PA [Anopheles gambiae str. PEST]
MSVSFTRRSTRLELLSTRALPQQKVIVITDKLGFEPNANKVTTSWLSEQYGDKAITAGVTHLNESSKYLLLILSQLERRFEPRQIFHYIAQCKKDATVDHVFVWIVEQKLQEPFLRPYLEHMADSVITFEDRQHLSLLVKKNTGAVTHKYYEFDPLKDSITVVEAKRAAATKAATVSMEENPPPNPASLGTFKIDLKDEEVAAKNALTLPFEFFKTLPEGGKILYHPDAEDDLDEEDPDDDLLI